MASDPHSLAHWRQPRHSPSCTTGLPALCCSILPARDPQPIPRFFSAPPKPVDSCPLKWFSEITTSASMMARPILAVGQYSALGTGTSTSSVPRSPSAMISSQPVVTGPKPFSWAAARCSRAFFRRPGYRVLQSVRKGSPPWRLTASATVFA